MVSACPLIVLNMIAVARKGPLKGLNVLFFYQERYKNDVGAVLFGIKGIILK